MPKIVKVKRANTAGLTPSVSYGELAYNAADNKLYAGNAANVAVLVNAGGGGGGSSVTEIAEFSTAAAFPATGASNVLYISRDHGRVFRWDASGVYVEIGTSGGGGGAGEDATLRSLFIPPAPTSVMATGGNAQATVSWTAPTVLAQTPITDYTVQFSSNSGSTWTTFTRASSATASATVTGLTNGTAYTFRVAAVNGVGTGAYSAASAAVTPTAAVFRAIPVLTSNTSDGTASTNNTWGGNPNDAWSAFDGTVGTWWYSDPSGPQPPYLQYSFAGSQKSKINGYVITTDQRSGFSPGQIQPPGWTFAGSNNGVDFVTIDTRSGVSWSSNGETKSFALPLEANYSTYRWTFANGSTGYVSLSTVQLLENIPS